ncbi:MAG TPA: molybdopterin-synthase adenylyltransferase MoeB [Spongiibacteraceae bacterium]|nr:molybdopterin-synthase adenylyltransferase MoeB [Spongiibacteraceae bacterium]
MNDEQLLRYSRQIMLPDFDIAAQEKLLAAKVLIVGLGGLGSPVALYLAAAGVGELWLADHDVVDLSNLQRQIAHGENAIGRAKVASAADAVRALNSQIKVNTIEQKIQGDLLDDSVAAVDLVVDCSDNFRTRFALNAACWKNQKPLVSGAAIRSEGQLLVIDPRRADSPCYRCLYDDAVQDEQLSCAQNGVLAPLVGVIGTLQALEAIKLLANYGTPAIGKLLIFDAKALEWRSLVLPRAKDCTVCGER